MHVFFALLANLALAQSNGQAEFTLGGATFGAEINPTQSDWSGSLDFGSVSLNFRSTDVNRKTDFGGFTLSFEFSADGVRAPELAVLQMKQDGIVRLFSRHEEDRGGLEVAVTSLEGDGNTLKVSGTVFGNLGTSADFGRNIDLSVPQAFQATFEVLACPLKSGPP